MMLRALIMLLFLSACSMDVHHSGGVRLELTVDDEKLLTFFKAKCANEFPSGDEALIAMCANAKIGEFLTNLSELGGLVSED